MLRDAFDHIKRRGQITDLSDNHGTECWKSLWLRVLISTSAAKHIYGSARGTGGRRAWNAVVFADVSRRIGVARKWRKFGEISIISNTPPLMVVAGTIARCREESKCQKAKIFRLGCWHYGLSNRIRLLGPVSV
jgi:hypothetical protein